VQWYNGCNGWVQVALVEWVSHLVDLTRFETYWAVMEPFKRVESGDLMQLNRLEST
jgi:hypothetical protein